MADEWQKYANNSGVVLGDVHDNLSEHRNHFLTKRIAYRARVVPKYLRAQGDRFASLVSYRKR